MTKSNSCKRTRGQALILVALAIVGLVGIAGLVIDGGNVFLDRRKAQNAADTAALAAALTRVQSGPSPQASALAAAKRNGYDNNGVTNTVEIHIPPISGPNKGDGEYIQVIITSHVKTYLASVVGWRSLTNTVIAVSRTKPSEVREILDGQAVISLAPTSGCSVKNVANDIAFYLGGETTLEMTGGGVFVNSDNQQCAFVEEGSGSIRIQDHHNINVHGGASIQKPLLLTPGVTVGVGAITYPPPFFMPKVGCGSKKAEVSEDGTSMSPGNWGEPFPPPGVTHLDKGIYCLDDGIDITGDIEGHNVIFRVEKGEVHWDGGAKIMLDGPNSGELAGLLLYLPMTNHSKVVLNAGPESVIKGTILAPASIIHINGNASPSGYHSQIIGYMIDANSTDKIVIKYQSSQNYNAVTMPEIQLSE